MKKRIIIVISAIVLSLTSYGVYSYYQINNMKGLFENPTNKAVASGKTKSQDNATEDERDPLLNDPFQFSNRVNFLFLGLDANKQRYKTMGSFRTDTIMLISIDFDNEKVDIISIPRDSYVEIPGRQRREKINAAFVRGGGFEGDGFDKTMETVSHFLGGIPIDYYVGVDMNVVKDFVDIMDGIYYDVDVRVKLGSRVIEKGYQHLDGQQVLDYARFRKTARGDIDRIERQQKIVMAIFNELKSTDQILKLPRYYTTVMERVHTNLNIKQIAGLALFATKIDLNSIQPHTIPGGFLDMDKISYWGVDEHQKKELIEEIFGVEIQIDPRNDIKYIRRELAEKEKAFKEAVALSEGIIETGNELLENYEQIVKHEEISQIESFTSQINHAVEDGDTENVKRISLELQQYLNSLQATLEDRNNAILAAHALVANTLSEKGKYQSFISNHEQDTLNKKIEIVNQAIDSKEVGSINRAVEDLESYVAQVFQACQQRKEDKEKTDKGLAERDQAIKIAQTIIAEVRGQISNYDDVIQDDEKSILQNKISIVEEAIKSKDTQAINKAAQDLKEYGADVFRRTEQAREANDKDAAANETSD